MSVPADHPVNWGFLSSYQKIDIIFYLQTNMRSSSIFKILRSSHIYKKLLRSSSICQKKLRLSSIYKSIEVVFQREREWGHLLFTKEMRLSSIHKENEVVFHLQQKKELSSIKKILRSSSIYKINWCCLPFTKKLARLNLPYLHQTSLS